MREREREREREERERARERFDCRRAGLGQQLAEFLPDTPRRLDALNRPACLVEVFPRLAYIVHDLSL